VAVYAIEADVVRAKHLWPRSLIPPPLTGADRAYYTDALLAHAQRPEQRVQVCYSSESTTGRDNIIDPP
jgi:membrane protein